MGASNCSFDAIFRSELTAATRRALQPSALSECGKINSGWGIPSTRAIAGAELQSDLLVAVAGSPCPRFSDRAVGRSRRCAAAAAIAECQSEAAAIRRAEGMLRDPANAGGRIQACRRSERWRVFGRGRTEEVRRCAGRFERAATMVLLLRDHREPRLDLPCRRRSCSAHHLPRLRRSRAPPQRSDSVAMGAIAGTADAHSKRRF